MTNTYLLNVIIEVLVGSIIGVQKPAEEERVHKRACIVAEVSECRGWWCSETDQRLDSPRNEVDVVRVAVCTLDVFHGNVTNGTTVIICRERTEYGSSSYVGDASLAKSYGCPMLHLRLADGSIEAVRAEAGDYRHYYAGMRDAIRSGAKPPVTAAEGLAVMQLLEIAERSAAERRELPFG